MKATYEDYDGVRLGPNCLPCTEFLIYKSCTNFSTLFNCPNEKENIVNNYSIKLYIAGSLLNAMVAMRCRNSCRRSYIRDKFLRNLTVAMRQW